MKNRQVISEVINDFSRWKDEAIIIKINDIVIRKAIHSDALSIHEAHVKSMTDTKLLKGTNTLRSAIL